MKNSLPSYQTVRRIRESYPEGTRVELDYMEDTQAPSVGTRGTVLYTDDIGTVHVKWDTGSSLGLVYGEDRFHKVEE